ncbi:MAG TPA: hypothetical protein VEB21_08290 [Terriglobales bacterium]|nr:hypothetical protein [Terriglobales bacterium]
MAPLLAIAIFAFYLVAIGAWLRREGAPTVLAVALLTAVALLLRCIFPNQFPAGWNEDEAKAVVQGVVALRDGPIYRQGVEGSLLFPALFQSQLLPLLGASHWVVRGYSAVCGALAVPAGFILARALRMQRLAALAAATWLATLPAMLFYGRVCFGGELLLHQMLTLAAAALLIWQQGSWITAVAGGIGLGLLLYDYPVGRSMVPLLLLACVLAPPRQRWRLLASVALGLGLWSFFFFANLPSLLGVFQRHGDHELFGSPWLGSVRKLAFTLRVFVEPVARDGWMAIQTAGLHPRAVLLLAIAGVILGGRRGIFLLAGFLFGLTPSLLSQGLAPSTHRMMMAFPFVALAAALGLDRAATWSGVAQSSIWRAGVIAAIVLIVAGQGVAMYFAPAFWPPDARARFDWERTAVVLGLPDPPHPRFLPSASLGAYFGVHGQVDNDYEFLHAGSWWRSQPRPVLHLFDWMSTPLQAFYLDLLGQNRVAAVGRAFSARIDAEDWAWLGQYGWRYRYRCSEGQGEMSMPTLFLRAMPHLEPACSGAVIHEWSGRWNGPWQALQLEFSGRVEVDNGSFVSAAEGFEATLGIVAEPGAAIRVRLESIGPLAISLSQVDGERRLPRWEQVSPLPFVDHD